jgi:type IV secretion system protein VirB10
VNGEENPRGDSTGTPFEAPDDTAGAKASAFVASAAARVDDDSGAFALRAAPRRIVRFRKGVLVAAAAGTLSLIAAISWLALDPARFTLTAGERDLTPEPVATVPEALEGLPQGYGAAQAPVLGPPLPGDLGRSILAHQRDMANGDGVSEATGGRDPAAVAAQAERERIIAENAKARTAPVLMDVSRTPAGGAPTPATSGREPPGARDREGVVSSERLQRPVSRWQVAAGSIIAASLLTGINSDLPGLVVAQVTEPVFDSASGRAVLIPQGARLIGRYGDKIAFGQRRAMVVWNRLVMPDGGSISLDDAPATDAAGYAGLADGVDFHSARLLRGIGLSTLLGVGTELSLGRGEDELARALRDSIQGNADRAGQKIVERNLDVAPTVTVRPGYPVRVLVHRDLVLEPWRDRR